MQESFLDGRRSELSAVGGAWEESDWSETLKRFYADAWQFVLDGCDIVI